MKCKNCNQDLFGEENFCSNCGQKNIPKLTLKYILSQFVEDIFDFDSKVFSTLKYLILKPGLLTKEYIDGKRVGSVPPVRLYIVLSVVFFFVVSVTTVNESEDSLAKGIKFSINNQELKLPFEELKSMDCDGTLDLYLDSLTEGAGFSGFLIRKQAKSRVDGNSFNDTLLNQVSLFLLLFLPLLALMYATIFSDNKYGFVGHLIFNLHYNSFVIFVLIIDHFVRLLYESTTIDIVWSGVLIVLTQGYLVKAISIFYKRKWYIISYKYLLLLFGYIVLAILFMAIVFVSSTILA